MDCRGAPRRVRAEEMFESGQRCPRVARGFRHKLAKAAHLLTIYMARDLLLLMANM
jgi:hypothetical protein